MESHKKQLKIPLTIITGYLGAGKTTLLRNIIAKNITKDKMKIAILMNEFGDISIDGKIVEGKNINMAELSGGCVCCSLAGEFEAAIGEILEKTNPEWIIVETTGVAEPAALAFDVVENIQEVRLDAIVTLVDADSMIRFPSLGHTGREQIELADLLIVNKTDLVSSEQLETVRKKLLSLNNKAQIIETQNSEFDLNVLFGLRDVNLLSPRKNVYKKHATHQIESEYFDFSSSKKLNYEKFNEFISTLPKEIFRMKGFVKSDNGDFFINFVAGRYTSETFPSEKTVLVFIGKNILKYKEELLHKLNKLIN